MFLSFMQNKSLSHNGFKVKPHALAIYYYISNMCDQHILQLSMSWNTMQKTLAFIFHSPDDIDTWQFWK